MASSGAPASNVPAYDPTNLGDVLTLPRADPQHLARDDCDAFHPDAAQQTSSHPAAAVPAPQTKQTYPSTSSTTASHEPYLTTDGQEAAEVPTYDDEIERSYSSDTLAGNEELFSPRERAVLQRLATSRSTHSNARSNAEPDLERSMTLDGVNHDSDVVNPTHEKFDLYKWTKMTLRQLDADGVTLKRSGVAFQKLNVSGSGSALNLQKNVGSMFMAPARPESYSFKKTPRHILHEFNGLMKSGELLIVLGRPGSGCSTLLKSLTGQLHGLHLDEGSEINYNGIQREQMIKEFRAEVVYNQEVDKHFPHLTVGQTLEHAAALRMPQNRPFQGTRQDAVEHITQVVMAVFGLSHTYNTKVGNDFVRGVSGGERKRVSIAEMALAGAGIAAWDNSTRGLDSATALTFVKCIRLMADLSGSAHAVAIYQASQAIYDLFDKAVVLYEGREIFFGKASKAKEYFERMGWFCPSRQTTGDFLTSVTNPAERKAREGFDGKLPRTPEDFEKHWKNSPEYAEMQSELREYSQSFASSSDANTSGGELQAFRDYKRGAQSDHTRPKSPYVVSTFMQIKLNTKRQAQRVWNDKASTFTPIISNIIMSLIIGSVFYDTPAASAGFTSKGATLFFAVLINALTAISEIAGLYDQRPIVEKHKSYAFYHPATEAISGIVLDIPLKFMLAVAFNVILYFMAGLRREPSQFFIFFLINFIAMFIMAAVFRSMAALTKTISQAMALSGVLVLAIVVYTGFVVPIPYMKPWFGWIRWINPIFYAFEILVANEFHGREFACSQFVPMYGNLMGDTFICAITGAVEGERTVSGDAYIQAAYSYSYSHVWRNFGILLAFLFAFMAMYFIAVEINSETSSTAEVLVFRRGHVPKYMTETNKSTDEEQPASSDEKLSASDEEAAGGGNVNAIPPQTDMFTWKGVSYSVPIKTETRQLLDDISGFVKPGTLTALMGTSGAGKTTLLDVLAQRTTMGVVTGSMFVNGAPLDSSFQRKTGYVQQQDLHLETATVRESLQFSAMLRQPKSVSRKEKFEYVEDVIKMLNMEDFAEAVVGVPGEGLNVEQRKLLTIGTELAAKPKLLLFLDEPSSGLDSQSSWSIVAFLRKLADSGQAVLCTIHQPSAILFQEFDRLLFLRKGGKTVYFGDIGKNSRTLLEYFEGNGARKCGDDENPAEYMLEIVGDSSTDWFQIWKDSSEARGVQDEIENIHRERANARPEGEEEEEAGAHSEFAMPFSTQLAEVTRRVFQQYWRMPSYIAAKLMLSAASGLFIGFSFYQANSSLQGMQNVIYGLFMVTTIFSTLVQQIMPLFVTQRSLYEVRERPSKAYSWIAFMIANILVEIPYQIVCGLIVYATFYYPIVGIQSSERQGLVLLLCVVLFVYAGTFAQMCIAALPDAQTAGAIVTFLFAMSLIFNGVMQAPDALPGFWIFMYRVSFFTYWVAGMAAAMLHGRAVTCSDVELSVFQPPAGQTCGQYMAPYLTQAPGTLTNPGATSDCGYCQVAVADTFLAGVNIQWSERWRNFGLLFVYIGFNVAAAVFLYWFFRVRTSSKKTKAGKGKKGENSETKVQAPPQEKKFTGEESEEDAEANARSEEANAARGGAWGGAPGAVGDYLTTNLGRVQSNKRNAQIV